MQQVLLPLCSQCCHHPLIRLGVTYFAWLVWASAIQRAGLSSKVSAAAFATHPWIEIISNTLMLPVIGLLLPSLHSVTSWSEQECFLSKKLFPPWLSLFLSAFCSWFTIVKCPELVSCLCQTPFSLQWPAEKNQGGGILLLCSWTSDTGISPLCFSSFKGFSSKCKNSAVKCWSQLGSWALWSLVPEIPVMALAGVTWLCISQFMWRWVSVTSGSVEYDFRANICHMTQPIVLFAPILFCFLMFCNWSIFVGICFSVWCALSWWCQM